MIHSNDILKRMEKDPIPDTVSVIRKKIEEIFSDLEFIESSHRYIVHDPEGDYDLPSVSSIVGKFEKDEDWDLIRKRYSEKHNINESVVKRTWEENNVRSTNNGTLTHLFAESMMHFVTGHPENISPVIMPQIEKGYIIPYSGKQDAVSSFYESIISEYGTYPVMAEGRVYTRKNDLMKGVRIPYAGTFDLLTVKFDNNGIPKLSIYDWKTNKSLFNDYNKRMKKMLSEPFGFMVDEPMSKYAIQQNLYAKAISQSGYEIESMNIVWLLDDGRYEIYKMPNLEKFIDIVIY